MANGRPGDSPLTDIIEHGLNPYGEDVGARVRSLHTRHPAAAGLLNVLLWEWPQDEGRKPLNTPGLVSVLEALETRLGAAEPTPAPATSGSIVTAWLKRRGLLK